MVREVLSGMVEGDVHTWSRMERETKNLVVKMDFKGTKAPGLGK